MFYYLQLSGVHAEKRIGHHVPQESVPRLSHGAQVQGMGQRETQARCKRVSHGQENRLSLALGAHIHRHAQRPAVRRETELGRKNGQNDSGKNTIIIVIICKTIIIQSDEDVTYIFL